MLCSGLEDWKQEYEMRHLEENRGLQSGLQSGNNEREKILQEKLELEQQCEERKIAEGKLLEVLF
jgi:collagenase-like PrtC family protease